jgi:GT2 family glycosyltransferase
MMWDFDLSVTICSWNTRDDLAACLSSLEGLRSEASFEVLVIDNNSQDESAAMVRERFPWVTLYESPKNLGFTGGQNFLIGKRKGCHAFLLNSDAAVHPGCIRTLLEFLDSNPQAGIVGPKILNPDGSLQLSCRKFPNPYAALFRQTFLGRWFPKNRYVREYLMADWAHDEPRLVDWVSGAAMVASEELIEEVGLMDPNYFMFCEDVDWCFRAWKAGFQVVYLPTAVVTHAIGRSTDKAPNRMIFRFHRSMFYFYRKNMLPQSFVLSRPFKLAAAALGLSMRAALFIVKNKMDAIRRRRQKG